MTNLWFVVDPVWPPLVLYGILLLLTALSLWIERKKNAPFAVLRFVAVIVMMLAVAGFLLRPHYRATSSGQIMLLTPQYDRSQADSLLNIYPSLRIFHSEGTEPFRQSVAANSYHKISHELTNIIYVLGQGLAPETLDLFPAHDYHFMPSPYPQGVIRLSRPDPVIQNRTATIEGIFKNGSATSKLVLIGPGGTEDSVSISKKGLQSFSLSFLPKNNGRLLYTLYGSDTLIGKLPVHVRKERQLDILFILSYPTFETRHLRDFLGQKHRLLLRYQISKNRFRFESINREPGRVDQLTKEALSKFDLVITDTEALRALRASEKKGLRSALQEGLGLLPLFNTPPFRSGDIIPFQFKRYAADTAHVFLNGGKYLLPTWPLSAISEDGVHSVLRNKNRILSGYRYHGIGKVGFQLIQETYRLMLQGDSLAYGSLWSEALEEISRSDTKASGVWLERTNFPLYPDAPVFVEINSPAGEPDVFYNDIKMPVIEDLMIDGLWTAKLWTGREGWSHIAESGDTILDLYTSNKNEWRSLAVANALERTQQAASPLARPKPPAEILKPLPEWIFYCMYLLAAATLWVVPKL